MLDVMAQRGIDLALGPKVADLLQAAARRLSKSKRCHATPLTTGASPPRSRRSRSDRFRDRAQASHETIDAALRALSDPERQLIGPTRWVVRAHVAPRDRPESVAGSQRDRDR
jgi:hypothetical protein